MGVVQLFAVAFAVFAIAVFVRKVAVERNFRFAVQFCLGIPIPAAALLVSLFDPESGRFLMPVAVVGACLFAAGFFVMYFPGRSLVNAKPDHVWTESELTRSRSRWLGSRALIVAGITTYVFAFEPAFGVTNAALLVLWVAIWIPRRLRSFSAENSVEIRVSPERVWEVLTDPGRQVLGPDIVDVVVDPPGRYRLGTRVMTVQRRPLVRPWRGQTEMLMRAESTIVDLVEGQSFTTVAADSRSRTMRRVEPSENGSLVTMKSWFVSSVVDGIIGVAFEFRRGVGAYRRRVDESLATLRNAIEGTA